MKICPRCQKTYGDDSLNFCLEDGSTLTQMAGVAPPPTVQMQQPFSTQQSPGQTVGQAGWNVGTQQPYSMQPPKKSSKAWVWVLLILGVLVLLCGGGFAGLVYIGSQDDGKPGNNTATNSNSSGFSNKNSNSSTSSGRTSITKLDLARWEPADKSYGDTDYADGEFTMSSKMKGYYYVLAGTDDQRSVNADSMVTVRNIDNAGTNLGFGLVFHSKTTPLQQGYALLIDSTKKRYRVVHHEPKKETPVINWTKSDAILDGTSENTLEVRDQTDTVDIYINGKKVNSIKNQYGYSSGVVGLYAGDGIKIGFKNLEIRK
ncbi:MAG: hypothetical protein IPM59_09880 [Chloracidobacterium sp.]|nr:hypothetical protein [Chloracidobacterium sp.]